MTPTHVIQVHPWHYTICNKHTRLNADQIHSPTDNPLEQLNQPFKAQWLRYVPYVWSVQSAHTKHFWLRVLITTNSLYLCNVNQLVCLMDTQCSQRAQSLYKMQ